MPESTTVNKSSGVNPTVAIVGALVVGVGGYFVVKPMLDRAHEKKLLDFEQKQNKSFKGAIIAGKKFDSWYNLAGKKITDTNLATIAADLNGALHPGWYIPTDQDRAVRVFMQTPAGMVKKLEGVYSQMEFGNLKKDLSDKLSDLNFIRIKPYFQGIQYEIKGI